MAHIVHRAFVYTLRLGKKSVSHVYIAMYGQQSPALEVKQSVPGFGIRATRTCDHHADVPGDHGCDAAHDEGKCGEDADLEVPACL